MLKSRSKSSYAALVVVIESRNVVDNEVVLGNTVAKVQSVVKVRSQRFGVDEFG
jgi:hypothetical protein